MDESGRVHWRLDADTWGGTLREHADESERLWSGKGGTSIRSRLRYTL